MSVIWDRPRRAVPNYSLGEKISHKDLTDVLLSKLFSLEIKLNKMAITRGDGRQSDPFVLVIPCDLGSVFPALPSMALPLGYSATIQNAFVDGTFGKGMWELIGRYYSESSRGNPGNGDMCQWIVKVNGQERSLWFDLSNVSQVIASPHLLAQNPPFSSFPKATAKPKSSWKFW